MFNANFQMSEAEVRELIGLDVPAAQQRVTAKGGVFRIYFQDGKPLPVTADSRPDRIDVAVQNDKVTDAHVG